MPPKPPLRAARVSSLPKIKANSTRGPSKPARPAIPKPSSAYPSEPHGPRITQRVPPPPSRDGAHNFRTAGRYIGTGLLTIALMITTRDYFVSMDTVVGSSMAPTLSPFAHERDEQDWILIRRDIWARQSVNRGDVVTFWKPHKPNETSIKRVVAIAGDIVYPHRGYALDPAIVHAERLAGGWDGLGQPDPNAIGGEEVEVGKVVVPVGHVWVEGDNWRKSYDSCDFGPVCLGLLDGKATWVWRDWLRFREVGDERKKVKGHWTRVVPGGARREGSGLAEF
ncbi:unnamed protein product [Periconia digitata]|uniref:Mitochondrial inner membrane protease subunit n=1 Tax=Periconia digitata TaxID=1303443 RepID=A0A9W4XJ80_9PLEO|nr:unnamed protein product [Periconia digitata]